MVLQSWLILHIFCLSVDACKVTLSLQLLKSRALLVAIKSKRNLSFFKSEEVLWVLEEVLVGNNLEKNGASSCPIV